MPNPDTPSKRELKDREKYYKSLYQAEKKAERERLRERKEEKRRERQERREQAEREKEARRLLRKEKRAKREEERRAKEREREEERAKREEEKRAKEREREEERARKEEERARREEERKAKEDERRKREAERAREEEEKRRRMEKQRAILMGFFVQHKPESAAAGGGVCAGGSSGDVGFASPFMQFELKKDQRQSPVCRVRSPALRHAKWQNVEDLRISWLSDQPPVSGSRLGLTKFGQPNYLHELRTGQIKPLSFPPTWPVEMPDGGGVPLQNMVALRFNHGDSGNGGTVWIKAKLLQFFENYRPAFYGTWRRRSYIIGPRRPFAKDFYQLDYEVDSDDEWEEEEPGENISQSDGEEEEEMEDDEDEDAKFLVPHGYLSDDEGVHDEDDLEGDGGDASGETAEMKRLRQRLSLAEYEAAHSRSLHKLKPLLLGPVWARNPLGVLGPTADYDSDDDKENFLSASFFDDKRAGNVTSDLPSKGEIALMRTVLCTYTAYLWPGVVVPIALRGDSPAELQSSVGRMSSSERSKKRFPDEALPYLIRLVHKNPLSKRKLQFEFREFWLRRTQASKADSSSSCPRYKECHQASETDLATVSADKVPKERGVGSTESRQQEQEQQEVANDNSPLLPKTVTMNKITEIAVFEEGLWRVRQEVLKSYEETLLTLEDLPEVDKSANGITDPDFNFPPWPYITDIAISTSMKRKSLHSISATPVSQPLPSASSPVPPFLSSPTEAKSLKATHSTVFPVSSPSITTVKRTATLETFFLTPSPSAKRCKVICDTGEAGNGVEHNGEAGDD